jgi:hypothetical protein
MYEVWSSNTTMLSRSWSWYAGPEGGIEHVRRHAGVVLVDEAPVGAHEAAVADLRIAGRDWRGQQVAADDLLVQRHRPRVGGQRHGLRVAQVRLPELEQAAGTQDGGGQRFAALQQFVDGHRFAARQPVGQRHVGGGEQADVVGVLPVDALEAPGDHQPDAGQALGRRAVLARRALAVAAARHGDLEAAGLRRASCDGHLAAALHAGVGEAGQAGVVVRQDGHRRDLVGRDVVAQRAGRSGRELLAGQLPPHRCGIVGDEQQARALAGVEEERHAGTLSVAR